MNEDDLRKSLLEEVIPEDEKRRRALLDEARDVWIKHLHCKDPAERKRLKERYYAIDRELGTLPEDEYERSGRRTKPRGVIEHEQRQEAIEKGRRRVVEQSKAGVREVAHQRIKSELNYLLNHYTPSNDNKIETLIDKWRRSGDPHYDPSIRLRFRAAQKKKAQSDYAK